jgi:release factor glutamine methyltransferase
LSTIQELFQKGESLLKDFPNTQLEAKLLLLKCLSLSEEQFWTVLDRSVSRAEERCFHRLISKRLKGIPLPYLTESKEFWSIPFKVTPGVLIPRPETELLVEKVLDYSPGNDEIIVDVGTGCGNIAISLAKELPRTRILATDISRKALRLARMNASSQKVSNITFAAGSAYAPLEKLQLEEKCDFIVSNPPYVSEAEWKTLNDEIRDHEPKSALVAGKAGLEVIKPLIQGAPVYLKPGGFLLFEIGYNQRDEVHSILNSFPVWQDVQFHKDLAGTSRVASARTRK